MKLIDTAEIIRSKNAGPFRITLDVLFKDSDLYFEMKSSGIWNSKYISELYKIPESDVVECIEFDKALAFKCTIKRIHSSGSPGDTDVYGSQQHVPLYSIKY